MAEQTTPRRALKSRGTGLGGTLILMVFVVVCLAVFSALSFVTARADLALSEKNTAALEAYYTADAAAQAKLARIDECLLQAAKKGGNYRQNAAELLTQLPDLVYQAGAGSEGDRVAFEIKVDEVRVLYVELAILPSGQSQRYRVLAYKTVNNSSWETASRIEVWQDNK